MDDDIPLTEGVVGPSSDTTPLFFMKRIDVGEEVSSVKDSVTSGTTKGSLPKGRVECWKSSLLEMKQN